MTEHSIVNPEPRPGYATTEFYAAGAIGYTIVEAGLLSDPNPWVRGAAVFAVAAIAIGYQWLRTRAKAAAATFDVDGEPVTLTRGGR